MNTILRSILILFSIIVFYNGDIPHFSSRVYITSIIIQIISILQIFNKKNYRYSFIKFFFIFSYLFFGIAPLLQFYSKSTFYGAPFIGEEFYFFTNIIVIFILIFYIAFYQFFSKILHINKIKTERFELVEKVSFSRNVKILIVCFICSFIVFNYHNFNILNIILRGGELTDAGEEKSTTIYLLIQQFIRPIPIICFMMYHMSKQKNILAYIVLLILGVVTCFPTGIPRFYAAAIYIPFLLIIFPKLRKENVLSILVFLGIFFIFPVLDNFRNFKGFDKIEMKYNLKMFETGHFDSFQNFALILKYDFITYGNQLLGVLFFWIPRTIWTTKPVGSGAYVAEVLNLDFSNISANYFAEGYINFGFIGIFIFIIILGYTSAKIDKLYWLNDNVVKGNYLSILYFILLGMLFFVLRGDLLSSFAFSLGLICSFYFVYRFLFKK
ncbi:O-antigen polysaccharide polymerase Wzy [Chryseobacterium sp. MYb264]|uniref:oligosaccharide repeat unit polymerase n=1 Tax=Chryseobacterium sp. MYb264 TaxID=2745153 RepID=UPI002E0F24FD|nr:O-antigen polysaccharide polymerase Wzy [Chryseobacterium sp. MYb264]